MFQKKTKKISILVNEEEKRQNSIANDKQGKIEENTRRWGETKKLFEERKGLDLKPLAKKDNLIINNKTDTPFINRFNLLSDCFFYHLIRRIPSRQDLINKDKLLLACMMELITVYIENASKFIKLKVI